MSPSESTSPQAAWRVLGVVLLLVAAWALRQPLLLVFGAVVMATLLRALADPLARVTPLSPRVAVGVIVLFGLVLLTGGLWLLGNPLTEQLQELRQQLPRAWAAARGWIERLPFGQRLLALVGDLGNGGLPWGNIASAATATINGLSALLLIVLIGIYIAVDVSLYRDGLVRLVPPAHRGAVGSALDAAGEGLSRWLLGQMVTMAVVGAAVAIGLTLLGMPMALALGVIAGLLEFVPFFGPIVAGALAVLVAFAQGPQQALYVALLFLAIQQIEGNVLVPLVQRWAVRLAPALTVAGVVVFGTLFGVAGVVFATPLLVVCMILVRELYVERALEGAQR
jgi:predicted PurR-regulated permease PerM